MGALWKNAAHLGCAGCHDHADGAGGAYSASACRCEDDAPGPLAALLPLRLSDLTAPDWKHGPPRAKTNRPVCAWR
jgi:hypothetical protein